jgi:hypothetical protein
MSKNGFWLLCLVPLAGCGVQGNWELRDVRPEQAAGCFDIAAATFNPDCTYVARLRKGDRTEVSRGTYDYDPWSRRLTLRSYGVERSYITTIWLGMQLNVESQTPEGKPMAAVMARTNKAVMPEARGAQATTR